MALQSYTQQWFWYKEMSDLTAIVDSVEIEGMIFMDQIFIVHFFLQSLHQLKPKPWCDFQLLSAINPPFFHIEVMHQQDG